MCIAQEGTFHSVLILPKSPLLYDSCPLRHFLLPLFLLLPAQPGK